MAGKVSFAKCRHTAKTKLCRVPDLTNGKEVCKIQKNSKKNSWLPTSLGTQYCAAKHHLLLLMFLYFWNMHILTDSCVSMSSCVMAGRTNMTCSATSSAYVFLEQREVETSVADFSCSQPAMPRRKASPRTVMFSALERSAHPLTRTNLCCRCSVDASMMFNNWITSSLKKWKMHYVSKCNRRRGLRHIGDVWHKRHLDLVTNVDISVTRFYASPITVIGDAGLYIPVSDNEYKRHGLANKCHWSNI